MEDFDLRIFFKKRIFIVLTIITTAFLDMVCILALMCSVYIIHVVAQILGLKNNLLSQIVPQVSEVGLIIIYIVFLILEMYHLFILLKK